MALIENQYLREELQQAPRAGEAAVSRNMDEHFLKDPRGGGGRTCKFCFAHRSEWYYSLCSDVGEGRGTMRKDKGKSGRNKRQITGYFHFCNRGNCFERHKCGEQKKKRQKK
jgi:hypothetical protein